MFDTELSSGILFGDICTLFQNGQNLTRSPPREQTLDGRWTRKPFGLSKVQPIYLSKYTRPFLVADTLPYSLHNVYAGYILQGFREGTFMCATLPCF